jgi:hypothetical protein
MIAVGFQYIKEDWKRFTIMFLNGKLEQDSDGVNYNLSGTVIFKEFVKSYDPEILAVILSDDIQVCPEIVIADNSKERCVKLVKKNNPSTSMLLAAKYIEKIVVSELQETTLTP